MPAPHITDRSIEDRFAVVQRRIANAYFNSNDISRITKPFSLNAQARVVANSGRAPADFDPKKEISLNRDMQNFSGFLRLVNVLPRSQQRGGSLMVTNQGRVTKTNDTITGQERRPSDPKESKLNEYEMVKAHSDFRLHDDDIDSMSEFPDWVDLYRASFLEAMSNDRIIIGWHGEKHEKTSDLSKNPLLQDVNKGWLQLLKERAPSQVLKGGKESGVIKIGSKSAGGDYTNLDHLVQDLLQGIPLHKRSPGLTALVSESIMGGAEGVYYQEQGNKPTEKVRIQEKAVTGMYGGLDSMPAPFMPQTGMVLTGLARNGQQYSNLSIYWQTNSWRRSVEYKASLESSIDWNARREAYHIEDLRSIVALDCEQIVFLESGLEINRIPDHHWAV